MSRGVDILLGEILEAIELLQQYTESLSYEYFRVDLLRSPDTHAFGPGLR